MMRDPIERQAAIDMFQNLAYEDWNQGVFTSWADAYSECAERIRELPSAQPEYEPVKTEDFAKTMSENTLYNFMAWHGVALELMERQGFVICKKTM